MEVVASTITSAQPQQEVQLQYAGAMDGKYEGPEGEYEGTGEGEYEGAMDGENEGAVEGEYEGPEEEYDGTAEGEYEGEYEGVYMIAVDVGNAVGSKYVTDLK